MPAPNPAFRQSVDTGLILPVALSRERQVWTKSEWRLLERTTKLLHAKGVQLIMRCLHETCEDAPIAGSRLADGSFKLTCNHCDRVMTKAF